MITVDKDIPMPRHYSSEVMDVMRNLSVGESFIFPHKGVARGVPFVYASRAGIKIMTQLDAEGNIRVWRRA